MAKSKSHELIKFSDFYINNSNRPFISRFIDLGPFQQPGNLSYGATVCFWIIYASLFAFFGMQIIYLVKLICDEDEKATVTGISSSGVWLVVGVISIECMLFIWLKGERLMRLLDRIAAYFPKTMEEQEYGSLAGEFAEWNMISTAIWRSYFISLYIIFFQPLMVALYGLIRNGTWFLKLLGLLWYPFDSEDNRYRGFAYIWEIWGLTIATAAIMIVSTFLGSTSLLLCSQFNSLAREFRDLKPMKVSLVADYKKLTKLSRKHNYLISMASELEDTYRVSLVVNYVMSSLVIAFIAFLLIKEDEINKRVENIIIFICSFFYNSLFSYYGNSLLTCVSILIGVFRVSLVIRTS